MLSIYLDHAATTPIRSEVRQGMIAILDGDFGNPSSAHVWGRRAAAHLEGDERIVAAPVMFRQVAAAGEGCVSRDRDMGVLREKE